MNPQQEKALAAFVASVIGMATLQKVAGRNAAALGLPSIAVALAAAVAAHELG